MPIEERRRIALHRHVSAAWGEEAADTLFELVTPAGEDLATRQHVDRLSDQMDRRFEQLDSRLEQLESRLGERFERRIADAVTAQTRTLVFSQLGALVAIAALALGLR